MKQMYVWHQVSRLLLGAWLLAGCAGRRGGAV